MEQIFISCAPGLETVMAYELKQLGLIALPPTPQVQDPQRPLSEESGGVEIEGTLTDIYRANLHLRTASRVLVRLGKFYAAAFPELRKKAARLPWEIYLKPGQPVAFRASCHKSRLYHSDAVIERVAGAIGDRTGYPPRLEKFDELSAKPLPLLIVIRLIHDLCTISVDSSGQSLYRRGYRLAVTKASLRETLAAGTLIASGWPQEHPLKPLLDPFCGSGTIPIEAALLARQIPPGRKRHFAFMDWPGFDRRAWKALLEQADSLSIAGCPPILASDRDAGAIEAALANASRAGVKEQIIFTRRPISAIEPPAGPGWVITNPPYGVRLNTNKDLRNLYARFGDTLRQRCPGWQAAVLCNDPVLMGHSRLNLADQLTMYNGGIRVKLFIGSI